MILFLISLSLGAISIPFIFLAGKIFTNALAKGLGYGTWLELGRRGVADYADKVQSGSSSSNSGSSSKT